VLCQYRKVLSDSPLSGIIPLIVIELPYTTNRIDSQSFVCSVTFQITELFWLLKFRILSVPFGLLSDLNLSGFGCIVSLGQLKTIKRQVAFV
jgi:hypothetical protein